MLTETHFQQHFGKIVENNKPNKQESMEIPDKSIIIKEISATP
jgi:hypothetical protein